MRLHHLEISAFGPYAGTVEVDMDELGADGLFLLHGDTGAGKTTVLDAVAFALYGTVPGARGEAKRLRCDRADPSAVTKVVLEATIAGSRIVVTRSPEYERPKKSGVGTTVQKAAASLRWVGGAEHRQDVTSFKEVGEVVRDLLGMSAEQFFQVVLLPQGEFARFLRAGTAERASLLERLFDTTRFSAIEEEFVARRRAARRELDEANVAVAESVARVAEALGIDDADPGPPEGTESGEGDEAALDALDRCTRTGMPSDPDEAWLSSVVGALEQRSAVSRQREAAERSARDEAAAVLADARDRDATLERRRALMARREHLLAQAEQVATLERRITEAERAQAVAASHRALMAAEEVREAAAARNLDEGAAVTSVWRDVSTTVVTPPAAPSNAASIAAVADQLRDEAGGLGPLLELDDHQRADRQAIVRVEAELAHVRAEQGSIDTELAAIPDRRATAQQGLDLARDYAARLPGLEAALEVATRRSDAAVALEALRVTVAKVQQDLTAATAAYHMAREARLNLLDRRLAGIAAELAGGLVDEDRCPVCGSTDHPAPAQATADHVGAADVTAAQQQEDRLREMRDAAQRALIAAEESVRTAEATAAGWGREEAAERRRHAADAVTAARRGAEALSSWERQAADVQAHLDDLHARSVHLAERRQHLETANGVLQRQVADRAVRLADAAGTQASVGARREKLLELSRLLDRWATAAGDLERAASAVTAAAAERDSASVAAGFARWQDAIAAASLDLVAARAAVTDHRQALRSIEDQLSDAEIAPEDDGQSVDIESVRALWEDAERRYDAAKAQATLDHQRLVRGRAAGRALARAWQHRDPIAAAAERMSALTDVIQGRGQNARALSLRSFVLALKLQQVADVASRRLQDMSHGRYSFEHSVERESHGRAGGLGLDILDAHSGLVRSAKTLSGGESFLASLALALGLADVVAADAGGRMLDTVVIDEGFGSLDADALDLVMATLDELRAGGRVVGVVSHVADMRQRIPSRLRVVKTPTGSTLELSTR